MDGGDSSSGGGGGVLVTVSFVDFPEVGDDVIPSVRRDDDDCI